MIRIIYDRENSRVDVSGHAYSDAHGKDLVCAAVSMLCHTLGAIARAELNSGRCESATVQLSSGSAHIWCEAKEDHREHVKLKLDTLCTGFELLQESYPEFVSYKKFGGNLYEKGKNA